MFAAALVITVTVVVVTVTIATIVWVVLKEILTVRFIVAMITWHKSRMILICIMCMVHSARALAVIGILLVLMRIQIGICMDTIDISSPVIDTVIIGAVSAAGIVFPVSVKRVHYSAQKTVVMATIRVGLLARGNIKKASN